MRANIPSGTASYVATLRGLGTLLPPAARLIDDPWGAEWTGHGRLRRLGVAMPAAARWLARPAWRWLLYMQVRTFVLDRAIAGFAESGGRQLVLLGAGLDARALRLRQLGLRVFEVDHPATQKAKRPLVGDAATLVACDFEHDAVRLLPARLAEAGYQPGEPGCVIWEGVTMYLSEVAIEETFAMLRELLFGGSVLAFTYFSLDRLRSTTWLDRSIRRYVARRGEPWRFGWDPPAFPEWLLTRGFALEHDDTIATLAPRWLPERFATLLRDDMRRIALASRRTDE